jgi:DNA-binding GntR family transcriptional regulator
MQRTRCILTLSKHVLGVSAPMPKRDPFMAEHLAIFKAIARSETGKAEDLLRAHLEVSCAKVSQRVAMVRDHYPTPDLPYIA